MQELNQKRKGSVVESTARGVGWHAVGVVAAGLLALAAAGCADPSSDAPTPLSRQVTGSAFDLNIQVLRPGPPVDAIRVGGRVLTAFEGSMRVVGADPGAAAVSIAPPGSVVLDLVSVSEGGATESDRALVWAVLDPPSIVRFAVRVDAAGGLEVGDRTPIDWPGEAAVDVDRGGGLAVIGDRLVLMAANGAWARPLDEGDWTRILESEAPAESVVTTARGPIVTAGRRAWTVVDGRFAGSASRLVAAPPTAGWPAAYAALRRPPGESPDGGAEIVAMDGALREVDRDHWRTRWSERVVRLAFDVRGLVVETETAIVRIGAVESSGDASGPARLDVLGRWPRPAGTRLVAFGPAEAVVLAADGRVHEVPVRAADPAPWARTPPAGPPQAVSFDGRTIRLWNTGDSGGAVDIGLGGRVRVPNRAPPADLREAPRLRRTIVTGGGTVRCVGTADDAGRSSARGIAVEGAGGVASGGRAWIATAGGLAVHDPADGRRIASAAVDGRIVWMQPMSGGRGVVAATDRGTVLRAALVTRRTASARP